jgi:hypothetical protein
MSLSKFSKPAAALPSSVRENLLILFVSKVKEMDKVNWIDADKSE